MFCKHCRTEKEASAFYLSNRSKCKECVKTTAKKNRKENLEQIRAYDRMRGSMPHRVQARVKYQATEAFALSHAKATAKWKQAHPQRRSAQIALGNAVKRGTVTPWPVCALPDCSDKPQAHHPDYDRPLDVVWLCQTHHKEAHATA